jgi:two-component system response regulator RegX3
LSGPLPNTSVLVVADDEGLLDNVVQQLGAESFDARVATTEDAALRMLVTTNPELVLVDLSMGGGAGRSLCERIRERSATPIIVLAGHGIPYDPAECLEGVADDFLPRPERVRELAARIRAVLRRRPSPPSAPKGNVLRVGDVSLDPERHRVVVRDEQVRLPLKQFQLLELLLENPGRVLPRTTILRRVWGSESAADSNTLEVQIKRLRENVEDDPSHPTRIRTVRGVGYMYSDRRW